MIYYRSLSWQLKLNPLTRTQESFHLSPTDVLIPSTALLCLVIPKTLNPINPYKSLNPGTSSLLGGTGRALFLFW